MANSRTTISSSILVCLGILVGLVSSLDISFCSSQNTGEFNGPSYWQFQSNGHCQDTCKDQFAYGILQGNNCWCSNYAPSQQVDTSQCESPCPGYPSENCGNEASALYGYYHLMIDPSGTQGAPATTSKASTQTSSSTPVKPVTIVTTVRDTVTTEREPTTTTTTSSFVRTRKSTPSIVPTTPIVITSVFPTVTSIVVSVATSLATIVHTLASTLPPITSIITAFVTTVATLVPTVTNTRPNVTSTPIPIAIPSSTSADQTTKNPPSSKWTPTPSTIITTVLGSVATVTVTPTIPPSAANTLDVTESQDSFWSSTGKVAGTFTAVGIVAVLLIGGLAFFFWRRRRSSDSVAINSVSDHDGHSTTGTFFGASSEKRHSRMGMTNSSGGNRGGSNERTPTMATPGSMSRRASQPLVHDQRLNPNALFAMTQDNGSHVSVGSFQDNHDYTRPVLHVRNPDSE